MSLSALHLELLHRLRIDGPIQQKRLEGGFPLLSSIELEGALEELESEDLAHRVKKRLDSGRLIDVWVANPKGAKSKLRKYKRPTEVYA